MAYFAKSGPDICYFRSNNSKQQSTPTSENNINRGGLLSRHYRHVPRAPTSRGPPSDQKDENPMINVNKGRELRKMGAMQAISYFL